MKRLTFLALFLASATGLTFALANPSATASAKSGCCCVDCKCPDCNGEFCTCDVCHCASCACAD